VEYKQVTLMILQVIGDSPVSQLIYKN